jgi:putative IMPACT (imprinted ancient) family translation regulator
MRMVTKLVRAVPPAAHVAPVKDVDDVEAVVAVLLQDHKVAAATHNIMAYRIQQPGGVWAQDHDDDGETAAGKNLLHLMQLVDVVDVVVVRCPHTRGRWKRPCLQTAHTTI